LLRFEKRIKEGKIILSKKERKRMEGEEIFLLLFPPKAILMNRENWRKNLQRYLSQHENKRDKRRACKFFCARSHKVEPDKSGEILLPQTQ